ncbi:MAG: hypothetical protein U0167_15220 [bacterium]
MALFIKLFQPNISGPAVDATALASAGAYLQILAVILDRWRSADAAEASAWVEEHAHLKPLYEGLVVARAPVTTIGGASR